jgi:carbon storage regulator
VLVISRVKNQSIVIGDQVEIMIVEIRGDKVRLAVTCPKEMPVHRKEVYDAIRQSDESSSAYGAYPSSPGAYPSSPPAEPPARSIQAPAVSAALPATGLDSAIDLLLEASSARLSPEEAAAARLILEAVRTKLK